MFHSMHKNDVDESTILWSNFFSLWSILRFNLLNKDLAFRLSICESLVSRYITTWICYLYHYLKEVKWMPEVEQVWATLHTVFNKLTPQPLPIVGGSDFSSKLQVIFSYNHLSGVATSIITWQNFWLPVSLMDVFASFHPIMLASFLTWS